MDILVVVDVVVVAISIAIVSIAIVVVSHKTKMDASHGLPF